MRKPARACMEATLTVTSERRGYTLTDRATWLTTSDRTRLPLLVEGDKRLFNVYHVIVVNPEKHPNISVEAARRFREFHLPAEHTGDDRRLRQGQVRYVAVSPVPRRLTRGPDRGGVRRSLAATLDRGRRRVRGTLRTLTITGTVDADRDAHRRPRRPPARARAVSRSAPAGGLLVRRDRGCRRWSRAS